MFLVSGKNSDRRGLGMTQLAYILAIRIVDASTQLLLLLLLLLLLRHHLALAFSGYVPLLITSVLSFALSLLLLHSCYLSTKLVRAILGASLLPTISTTLQKILKHESSTCCKVLCILGKHREPLTVPKYSTPSNWPWRRNLSSTGSLTRPAYIWTSQATQAVYQ